MNFNFKNENQSLTKYTFLNYLKGDFFAWLTDDNNYLKAAQQYEDLKKLSYYRYKRLKNKNLNISEFELPTTIIDGNDVSDWSKKYYINKYQKDNFKIYDFSLEELGFDNLVKKTFEIMQKEKNFILFEGAFVYNGFKIRTDVIINKNGKFKLCEVKAITNCLEYHALDIMFQAKILQKNGYDIDNWILKLTILNNNFKLFQNKEDLQINELIEFNLLNLFQEHDRYFNSKPKDLKKAIEEGKGFLIREIFNHQDYFEIFNDFDNFLEKIKINQKKDKLPKKDHFEGRNFNYLDSEYFPFFLKYMGISDEKSIFLLGGDSWFNNKRKGNFFNIGIKNIDQIENLQLISNLSTQKLEENIKNFLKVKDFNILKNKNFINFLNKNNNSKKFKRIIQKNAILSNENFILNYKILNHLQIYKKVIYMYDFETVSQAIPRVKNMSTYEQVPYQYSIHIILDKDDFDFKSGKNIIHLEWLAKDNKDFYEDFWSNFTKDMQKYGPGSYVSYNKQFEKTIISNYINRVEYKKKDKFSFLLKIYEETLDMMEPFANYWYYSPDFLGSYSIKVVGPHFVPDISYKDLDIRVQKGDQSAKQAKIWLIQNNSYYDDNWLNVRNAMLKYCCYDTLLMVAIFQRLKEFIAQYNYDFELLISEINFATKNI
ncbi:hypothetical protein X271_00430 [Candidatus Hepatoplasma crinochetorum Av]|uniref:DUF2779 domain-containing protein n=1 Tax=Candidatus Hepatoplasma crinochetorum Av TaxID=1427984 RepID=W8GSZ2_9MOLU|nr:DUF2779 domain-containing protein [Candidatus Hepatoplasma crinochetorum]AHK22535.1 hypothetical protein X271_00430 [Candidatus Hepatoplasma crinochetorum Av]